MATSQTGWLTGTNPWKENLGRGSGMKEARKV
jgi:hypothetical protein